MITRLSALGFPVVVCEKALRLCKGNETLAANWLMDNGAREAEVLAIDVRSTEALANPFSDECEWGTEGVDFFQVGDASKASRPFHSMMEPYRKWEMATLPAICSGACRPTSLMAILRLKATSITDWRYSLGTSNKPGMLLTV